jgi:hypothetical protein
MKPILRSLRRCLKSRFMKEGHYKGTYHVIDEELFNRIREWMDEQRATLLKRFTEQDVAYMVALIFPNKATKESKRKGMKGSPACPILVNLIGLEEAEMFKKIFQNNSKKTLKVFFNH